MIYCLIAALFGLSVVGFALKNVAVGVVSLTIAAVLAVYRLIFVGNVWYSCKLKRIKNDPNASASFSPAEIASHVVDFKKAKQTLSPEDYLYFGFIKNGYAKLADKLALSYIEYLTVRNEIVANFDLVAPYTLFCGEGEGNRLPDDDRKSSYRIEARKLIDADLLFKKEWLTLLNDFMNEFYA